METDKEMILAQRERITFLEIALRQLIKVSKVKLTGSLAGEDLLWIPDEAWGEPARFHPELKQYMEEMPNALIDVRQDDVTDGNGHPAPDFDALRVGLIESRKKHGDWGKSPAA